jgi:ribosomal protein S12 methylthiotransferase accessory factor YcaO
MSFAQGEAEKLSQIDRLSLAIRYRATKRKGFANTLARLPNGARRPVVPVFLKVASWTTCCVSF